MEGQIGGRWQEDERDRLRALHSRAMLALGQAMEARDAHPDAADLYLRLSLRDELNEEVHRRLMLAWARAGERARALRHFEQLVLLLREQLDAEPEPDSVRLQERIRAGAV
jgi:DNA-binding SARP family transcriptional activator